MSSSFEGRNEQLIKLVRKHPELYDHQHTRYYDASYKNKVWNMIGAIMEEDSLVCKNRWCNIRDQYRKNVKKRLSNRGKKTSIYKFSEELSFLTEHADTTDVDQDSQSSILQKSFSTKSSPCEEPIKVEATTLNLYPGDDFNEFSTNNETIGTERGASNSPDAPADTYARVSGRPKISTTRKIKRPARKRLSSEPATAKTSSSRAMELLLQQLEEVRNPDPVDAFLIGLSPALKNLPPHYWYQAKSEIFSIVQKYELKTLNELPPT